MRSIKAGCILLACILLFTGCQMESLNSVQTIVPPVNDAIPIQGTWEIKDYKSISDLQEGDEIASSAKKLLGKAAIFTHDWARVAGESTTGVQYQIRRVNAGDYFLFHHNIDARELNIQKEDIEIISITSDGVLFFDIIRVDDTKAVIYMDKCFYLLEKVSDGIEEVHDEKGMDPSEDKDDRHMGDKVIRSGVFLGLRSTVSSNDDEDRYGSRSSYRTIWISSYNRKIESVLETSNLFIPRRSGFWKLDVGTRIIGGFLQDYFILSPVDYIHFNEPDKGDQIRPLIGKNIKKNILFVSDDYIAIEYSETPGDEIKEPDRYRVLPLDDANSQKGITISNIADEGMEDIFYKSAQSYLVSRGRKISGDLREMAREDNFTVARRNGHWILKGRLDIDGNSEDFNIGLMPEGKLLNYDKLHVTWDEVKERIPMALDAYTSPAKDILIAVTGNFIMVYPIEDGQIAEKPIRKIGIKKGETVIMAEWATGDYVPRWEKSFNQINPFIVNE